MIKKYKLERRKAIGDLLSLCENKDLSSEVIDIIRAGIESYEKRVGYLQKLSIVDSLTGLYNRRHFNDSLEEEIERSTRHGGPLSLIILDVDDFKSYNDNYGHV